MRTLRLTRTSFILLALVLAATPLTAQEEEKRPIPLEEYARYRSISSVSISDDGTWVSYAFRRREADDSLYVSNPATGKEYLIPRGSGAVFSEDSRWVAYSVTVPWKEAEKLQEENDPVPRQVG